MTKILIGMLSLALVGVGGSSPPSTGSGTTNRCGPSPSPPAERGTTSAEDVSGPCDEPEHATD